MDMPTPETPPEAYLIRSAYTIARVGADPKAAGREAGLDAAHTTLRTALGERVLRSRCAVAQRCCTG
jgi:hypothetical protein